MRSAAVAMNTSGQADQLVAAGVMLTEPRFLEAQPVQAPAVRSRSYSSAVVGDWPTGWKGADRYPFIR